MTRYLTAILLLGCTEPQAPDPDRQGCYAEAELEAAQKAATECPDTWSDCPHRDRILAELKTAQETCP